MRISNREKRVYNTSSGAHFNKMFYVRNLLIFTISKVLKRNLMLVGETRSLL